MEEVVVVVVVAVAALQDPLEVVGEEAEVAVEVRAVGVRVAVVRVAVANLFRRRYLHHHRAQRWSPDEFPETPGRTRPLEALAETPLCCSVASPP